MVTERRLIDPSEIIRGLTAMKSEYDAITLDGMIKALKEATTVDAVEVVRCRDCQYWKDESKPLYCNEFIGDCIVNDETVARLECDFCSYGERRTDND